MLLLCHEKWQLEGEAPAAPNTLQPTLAEPPANEEEARMLNNIGKAERQPLGNKTTAAGRRRWFRASCFWDSSLRLKIPRGHFLLPRNLRGQTGCSPLNAHDIFDHGGNFSQLGMFIPNANAGWVLKQCLAVKTGQNTGLKVSSPKQKASWK